MLLIKIDVGGIMDFCKQNNLIWTVRMDRFVIYCTALKNVYFERSNVETGDQIVYHLSVQSYIMKNSKQK